MNVPRIYQCCYTNTGQETNRLGQSGWQAVAVTPDIPKRILETCKDAQSVMAVSQSYQKDLYEIFCDASSVYVIHTSYALLDSVGRGNVFSHAYIFPLDFQPENEPDRNPLKDPNVFLSLSPSSFKTSEQEALRWNHRYESLDLEPPLDLETALKRVGLTGRDSYRSLLHRVYATMRERGRLFVPYDGSYEQMRAYLYCIWSGLPFFLRRRFSAISSPDVQNTRISVVFTQDAAENPDVWNPARQAPDPQNDKRIRYFRYLDYASELPGREIADFYAELDRGVSLYKLEQEGDPDRVEELLKILCQKYAHPDPVAFEDDKEIVDWLSDTLNLPSYGGAEMEEYIAGVVKLFHERKLKLPRWAEKSGCMEKWEAYWHKILKEKTPPEPTQNDSDEKKNMLYPETGTAVTTTVTATGTTDGNLGTTAPENQPHEDRSTAPDKEAKTPETNTLADSEEAHEGAADMESGAPSTLPPDLANSGQSDTVSAGMSPLSGQQIVRPDGFEHFRQAEETGKQFQTAEQGDLRQAEETEKQFQTAERGDLRQAEETEKQFQTAERGDLRKSEENEGQINLWLSSDLEGQINLWSSGTTGKQSFQSGGTSGEETSSLSYRRFNPSFDTYPQEELSWFEERGITLEKAKELNGIGDLYLKALWSFYLYDIQSRKAPDEPESYHNCEAALRKFLEEPKAAAAVHDIKLVYWDLDNWPIPGLSLSTDSRTRLSLLRYFSFEKADFYIEIADGIEHPNSILFRDFARLWNVCAKGTTLEYLNAVKDFFKRNDIPDSEHKAIFDKLANDLETFFRSLHKGHNHAWYVQWIELMTNPDMRGTSPEFRKNLADIYDALTVKDCKALARGMDEFVSKEETDMFREALEKIFRSICLEYDSGTAKTPLDIWLWSEELNPKKGNCFKVFDGVKGMKRGRGANAKILRYSAKEVLSESTLIYRPEYQQLMREYVQGNGTQSEAVKNWLDCLKKRKRETVPSLCDC